MNQKKLLAFGFFPLYLIAATPQSYEQETTSQTLTDMFWNNASHEVSASLFYQQAFGDELTYLDGTFLGYYATGRYKGFKAATGINLAGPIFVLTNGTHETYTDVKQIFLWNTIYGDYLNNALGLQVKAGRYNSDEEWNTYYSQGFALTYKGLPYTQLHLTASYGSALVTDEYVTPFRSDLSSFGTYLTSATFKLPHHIKLMPYVYATGFFTAFGMKAQIGYHVTKDIEMETKLHIIGYSKYYAHTFPVGVNHKFELAAHAGLANQNMAGIAWIEQKIKYNHFLEAKLGLIGVTDAGAELIDYYGQTSPFKYNVGMFWGGAVTVYGSLGIDWNHIVKVKASIRDSFLPTGNIVSFELKSEGKFPIWRQRDRAGNYHTYMQGTVGISAIGVYNNTPAINFYGGNNFTLIRGYFKVSL